MYLSKRQAERHGDYRSRGVWTTTSVPPARGEKPPTVVLGAGAAPRGIWPTGFESPPVRFGTPRIPSSTDVGRSEKGGCLIYPLPSQSRSDYSVRLSNLTIRTTGVWVRLPPCLRGNGSFRRPKAKYCFNFPRAWRRQFLVKNLCHIELRKSV